MNVFRLLCFVLLASQFLTAQQVTVLVKDQVNGEPIPYATIQFEEGRGIITNEEGYFAFTPSQVQTDSLTISCMGYLEKTIPLTIFQGKEAIVGLERNTIALNDVKVYATLPNIDSIMNRVRRNLSKNYANTPIEQKIFHRQTEGVNFKKLGVDIERSTLMNKEQMKAANEELADFARPFTTKPIKQYSDFLLTRSWADSSKVEVTKATYLFDLNKTIDPDVLQEKGQEIILKYLDSSMTYKVKTGLFKVEDSLKIDVEAMEEAEEERDRWSISHFKGITNRTLRDFEVGEASFLKKLLDPKYYEYELEEEVATYGDQSLFVIRFEPRRRKAKYSGTLYINDDDFAIVRTDYSYAEGRQGQKVNLKFLLGVRFAENLHRGSLFFRKNEAMQYVPHYAKRETGQYVYVKRPFKFIENSEERNKLKCEFLVEMNVVEKDEMIILEDRAISKETFLAIQEEEKFEVETLQRYDPTIWQEYQVLSPVDEMKTFGLDD